MTIRIVGRTFLKEFVRGLKVINYEHVDTKGAEKHEVSCTVSITQNTRSHHVNFS